VKHFKLNSKEAYERRSLRIREIMNIISARLADGRKYLTGNQLSYIDIAFCSIAALLVIPESFGGAQIPESLRPTKNLQQYPSAIVDIVDEMRKNPAGKFVLRMYEDHRST
tara:strand:- start:1505 stop:1837 length:333 start_codon:yes stop_codon:yes gene_type:complete